MSSPQKCPSDAIAYIQYEFDEQFQQDDLFISEHGDGVAINIPSQYEPADGIRITAGLGNMIRVHPMTADDYTEITNQYQYEIDLWPDFGRDMFVTWHDLKKMLDECSETSMNVSIAAYDPEESSDSDSQPVYNIEY